VFTEKCVASKRAQHWYIAALKLKRIFGVVDRPRYASSAGVFAITFDVAYL